mmetsp:Transcript_12267/g.26215  ORF Transcript_12267/g.26215 Transcript_12267/m.26215 type:complete len:378 (-) Transcript_12267:175-1308(-)
MRLGLPRARRVGQLCRVRVEHDARSMRRGGRRRVQPAAATSRAAAAVAAPSANSTRWILAATSVAFAASAAVAAATASRLRRACAHLYGDLAVAAAAHHHRAARAAVQVDSHAAGRGRPSRVGARRHRLARRQGDHRPLLFALASARARAMGHHPHRLCRRLRRLHAAAHMPLHLLLNLHAHRQEAARPPRRGGRGRQAGPLVSADERASAERLAQPLQRSRRRDHGWRAWRHWPRQQRQRPRQQRLRRGARHADGQRSARRGGSAALLAQRAERRHQRRAGRAGGHGFLGRGGRLGAAAHAGRRGRRGRRAHRGGAAPTLARTRRRWQVLITVAGRLTMTPAARTLLQSLNSVACLSRRHTHAHALADVSRGQWVG